MGANLSPVDECFAITLLGSLSCNLSLHKLVDKNQQRTVTGSIINYSSLILKLEILHTNTVYVTLESGVQLAPGIGCTEFARNHNLPS